MRFFLIHGRHLSDRVQSSPTWTTMSSGNPTYHESHLLGRVKSSLPATSDVNNHEIRQPHLWDTVRVHITLPSVEELKHYKFTILSTMVSDLEKQWTLKRQPGWPAMGFEPGTSRMRVSCVTTETPRSVRLLLECLLLQNSDFLLR